MATRTLCTTCGKESACPESAVGRTMTCKFCGDRFTVQAITDDGPAPAVPGRSSAVPGAAPLPSSGGGAAAWGSASGAAPQSSGPSPAIPSPPLSQPVSGTGFPGAGLPESGFPGAGLPSSGRTGAAPSADEPPSRIALLLAAHAQGIRLPPNPSLPAYPAEGGIGEMAAAGCLGAAVLLGLPFFGLVVLILLFGGDRNERGRQAVNRGPAWTVAAEPLPPAGEDVPTHRLDGLPDPIAAEPRMASSLVLDAPPPWMVMPNPVDPRTDTGYRAFPAEVGKLRRVLIAPAGDGLLLTYGSPRAPTDFETPEDLVDVAGRLEARSLADGGLLYRAVLPKSAVPLAVDADGGLLATVSGKYHDRLDLWNAKTLAHIVGTHPYGVEKGEKLRDNVFGRPVYANTVVWAGFAGPDRLWTLSESGELAMWRIPEFRKFVRLAGLGGAPRFSPGRKYLAASRSGGIHLLKAESGDPVGTVNLPRGSVAGERMAFSPDGLRLARLLEDELRIVDLRTGKFDDRSIRVPGRELAWVGNDRLLVDGSLVDLTLGQVVWNYETGDPRATIVDPLPDGRGWLPCETAGRSFVAAVPIPDPGLTEALSRALAGNRPPEIGWTNFSARIELDLAGLPDAAGIRDELTRQLRAHMLFVHDDGDLTFTAKIHLDRMETGQIPPPTPQGLPSTYRYPVGRAELVVRDASGKTLLRRTAPIGEASAIRKNVAILGGVRLPAGFALEEAAAFFRTSYGVRADAAQPTHGKPPKLGYGSTRVALEALTPVADAPAEPPRPAPRRRPK